MRVVTVDAPAPVLEARWQDEQVRRWTQVQFFYDVAEMGYRVQLDYAAAYARAAYEDSLRQVTETEVVPTTRQSAPEIGSGRCGGVLPPCYVMMRESRGDIRAENPTSSASGKWQFLDSTWAGFGGYARASHAPESVQDAKAAQLWAGGAGCSHWSAC
jgi:hypothetical protein